MLLGEWTFTPFYVDLKEDASPDDYDALKWLMLKEFKVRPITEVDQIPVYLSPLFSSLPPIPLREYIERRIKESMWPSHPIVEVIEIEPIAVE